MDIGFTAEEVSFRNEVRGFFKSAVPPATREKLILGQRLSKQEIVEWQRILNARGWAVPHWPTAWGGTGWSPVQQYIFSEEMYQAPAPEPLAQNVRMVAPVILAFATEAQKQRFLPRIANLDYWFCQGFSEPNAGSDLASLRLSAERDGDSYILNGEKIWTTGAQKSDWIFLLARSDPKAAKKQEGISFLLAEMSTPGITVSRIETVDGGNELNQVFFDNVRVPAENLIGEENRGWDYAKYLLAHERTNVARIGFTKQRLRRVRQIASELRVDGAPLIEDPLFLNRLTLVEVELKALEITQMRVLADLEKSSDGGFDAKSSVLKLKGSELQQLSAELLIEAAGPLAFPEDEARLNPPSPGPGFGPDWAPGIAPTFFFSRGASIFGGSNEIQRGIIAKTIVGL